ncbi:MAG: ABC transporter permease [Gordonia sp. (in: high G+C Gram-positive bacteria)]|nr:MAG: ABC transporter permease [Gordonia sp. (in: high G+C Gram-positive bacteria)]
MTNVATPPTAEAPKPPVVSASPQRRLHFPGSTVGPPVALLVLFAAFSIFADGFLSTGNIQTLLDQAAIPLIVAMGLTLVILTGSIDLSVEGVMAACCLTFTLLGMNNANGLDLGYAAIPIALVVGAAFGMFAGWVHTRFKLPSFMVTLGTWSIGLGVATILYGSSTPKMMDEDLLSLTAGNVLGVPKSVIVAAVVVALGWAICRYTRLGRYAYSIGGDEAVTRLSGINVSRYKIGIFAFAGTCFGLAGILGAIRLGVGDVGVGEGSLFLGISAVVLGGTLLSGGRGGMLQSMVGVAILVVLGNGLILIGASVYWQQGIQAAVIIIAVTLTGWSSRERLRVIK